MKNRKYFAVWLALAVAMAGCGSSTAEVDSSQPAENSSAVESSVEEAAQESTLEALTPLETEATVIEETAAEETVIEETAAVKEPAEKYAISEDFDTELTTMELVRDMGLGINLGNTFESCGAWIGNGATTPVRNFETAWGSPVVTRELIQGYADCGFESIRIPVAWSNKMDESYVISQEYIDRVKEVVEWALEADLYVVLNIHWDGGWFADFPTKEQECMKKYEAVWKQLSDEFREYDEHLIFEALNEEAGWDELWNRWSNQGDKAKSFGLVTAINQMFVDIVRASGGNNTERHLLIAGYNTDIVLTCDSAYKMPRDPKNKMAISVHYYTPSTFAILSEDADWGKHQASWGSEADIAELNTLMDMMKTTYVDQGIPVIIGEYGCPTINKEPGSIERYISSVARAAYERQMCPMLWDTTGNFYNRYEYKFYDENLLQLMMDVKE